MTKQEIQYFIKSGRDKITFDTLMCINDIEEALKELDMENTGENDTNGWQIDFWYYYFGKEYGKYMLSGSLYYGGFTLQKH